MDGSPLAIAEAPSALLGIYQWIKAQHDLNELHKQPVAKFGETPEMAASRMRAEQLAQSGFTPQETAGFRKNISEDINTQSQKALDLGGGQLGRVISGQGKINEMKGESDFASRDAALHRQNIKYADTFSQKLQDISNMNIEQQLKQRLMAEQALGGAVKTGQENLTNALGSGLALGIGTGSKTPTTNPSNLNSLFTTMGKTGNAANDGTTPPVDDNSGILKILKMFGSGTGTDTLPTGATNNNG